MNNEVQDIVASIDTNKILILVLEHVGEVAISTEKFMSVSKEDKELVIDYDESGPSFVFSIRDKNNNEHE